MEDRSTWTGRTIAVHQPVSEDHAAADAVTPAERACLLESAAPAPASLPVWRYGLRLGLAALLALGLGLCLGLIGPRA